MTVAAPRELVAVTEPPIIELFTRLGKHAPATVPFPILRYADVMERYGIDRPDLRVELELHDFTACFADTKFRVCAEAIAKGRRVRGLVAPDASGQLSRKELDDLVGAAVQQGAGG